MKKRNYFAKYGNESREILEALLAKYADKGIENIETNKVLELDPLNKFGTPREITGIFGGVKKYENALRELENEIYKAV